MIACGNCRFWQPTEGMRTQGVCCCNPPVAFIGQSPAGPHVVAIFPPVSDTQCCGKGEAKPLQYPAN